MRIALRAAVAAAALSPAFAIAGPMTLGGGAPPHARPGFHPHVVGHPDHFGHRPPPLRHGHPHRPWTHVGVPYAYPVTVVIAPSPSPPPPPPVRPLSFHLADPAAVAVRLPSGRVAIGSSNVVLQPAGVAARPYAPPTIQIVGQASTRHMRGPVHLVHGVQPPKHLATDPRVIWLKEPSGGGGRLKPAE